MPHKTEADTCRQFVLPKLYASGWDDERIAVPLPRSLRETAVLQRFYSRCRRR